MINDIDHIIEKRNIVGNKDKSILIFLKIAFQPCNVFFIQIVGGLIQKKNIRITKNTLQLIPANLSCLEDALADGEEFRILHRPSDWENPGMEFGIYSSIPASDPITDFVNSELSQKRLRFYLPENDLSKALHVRRKR